MVSIANDKKLTGSSSEQVIAMQLINREIVNVFSFP